MYTLTIYTYILLLKISRIQMLTMCVNSSSLKFIFNYAQIMNNRERNHLVKKNVRNIITYRYLGDNIPNCPCSN